MSNPRILCENELPVTATYQIIQADGWYSVSINLTVNNIKPSARLGYFVTLSDNEVIPPKEHLETVEIPQFVKAYLDKQMKSILEAHNEK